MVRDGSQSQDCSTIAKSENEDRTRLAGERSGLSETKGVADQEIGVPAGTLKIYTLRMLILNFFNLSHINNHF